jgi:hypothetical protein
MNININIFYLKSTYTLLLLHALLPRGVTGNTSDSGSEESRFEPWRGS